MGITHILRLETNRTALTIVVAVLGLITVTPAVEQATIPFYVMYAEDGTYIPLKNLRSLNITKVSEIIDTNSQNFSESFLIYKNPIYGFELKYPENWDKTEERGPIVKDGNSIVVSFAPEQFRRAPKLFMQVEALSQNISLNELVAKNLDHLRKTFGEGLGIVEQGYTILPIGNLSAYRVVHEFNVSNVQFKKMDIWMVKDDLSFIISYISEKMDYDKNFVIISEIVGSFNISN